MAITHEYTGVGDYLDVSFNGSPASISWSHTSSGGSDCIALIGFMMVPDITRSYANRQDLNATVTYGSRDAMFIGYSGVGSTDTFGCVYWFAVQDPPSGAQTVTATVIFDEGIGWTFKGCSVSYRGVRGIHRVDGLRGNGSTGTITIASAPGRKLVHVGGNSGTTFSSYNQNLLWSHTTSQSAGIGDADGASSVTFSWDRGSSAGYGSSVLELIPVDEPQNLVTIRSIGEGEYTTGTSSTLGTSWIHRHDNTFASFSLAVVAVTISVGSGVDTSSCSVTFGGQLMTQLAYSISNNGSSSNAVGFYYLPFPPTGSSTVSVTTGGGGTKYAVMGESVIYENAMDIVNLGSVASLNVDVNNSVYGTQLLVATVNAANINTATKNELYNYGALVGASGDYGLIQSSVGTGGTVNFNMSGTSSVPLTQAIQVSPNQYNRDFLQMFH